MEGQTDQKEVSEEAPETAGTWGGIHCAECEVIIAHIPPDVLLPDNLQLEAYCTPCKVTVSGKQ